MRIVIGLILLIASAANAQDVSGFMGIKFGTKYEDAKKAMLAKDGAVFDRADSDSTKLYVTNVEWGGYSTYCVLLWIDDSLGLYQGIVALKPEESRLLGYYSQIFKALKAIYGQPTNRIRSFSAPYKLGDGREIEAVGSGKASIEDDWHFPNQNDLGMHIDADACIEVIYDDPDRLNEAWKRMHKGNSGDY